MLICTFNIRKNKDTGLQSFENRLPLIKDFLDEKKPDIIGFQEVMPEPYESLKHLLKDYGFEGTGRLSDGSNEAVPLFYREAAFEKVLGSTFWLSETPDVPGSKAFDTYWPRICTFVKLKERESGRILYVYNAHLDNLCVPAIKLGTLVITEKIREYTETGAETVLMGDLNSTPESGNLSELNNYGDILKDISGNIDYTYQEWGTTREKIDYIYISPGLVAKKPATVYEKVNENGTFISDHWPVYAEILFK